MSKVRCIIVEDEPLAAKVLVDYIQQVPFLELRGQFKDAILATDFLREQTVDLIFLDIHLPKLKGMAFLKTLTNPPAVIITTAYHQYAVEGFELNVADYLLKPFSFERFLIAVNKLSTQPTISSVVKEPNTKDHIFVNVQKKKVKILFDDIIYIESQREYIKILTTKGDFYSKMTTNEVEAVLPVERFRRIHRSYIISLKKIQSYTHELIDVGGVTLPIGRNYRDTLGDL
jgi:two-component system LytT family response regulator